jgi:hypothetical protein
MFRGFKMSLSDLVDTTKKNIFVIGALGLAIITGTYLGNEGGFPPFHNKKAGTAYGINVGASTEFMPGSRFYGVNISPSTEFSRGSKFYGINISGWSNYDSSEVNGIVASIANMPKSPSRLNGIEIGLINSPKFEDSTGYTDLNGLQIGLGNNASMVNGAQIGIFGNFARAGHLAQLGIYNSKAPNDSTRNASFLLNFGWKGE